MRLISKKRVEGIVGKIAENGLDAALFVNSEPILDSNIAYLSGFSGMLSGALFVSGDGLRLMTTELDYERAQSEATVDEVLRYKDSKQFHQFMKQHCSRHKKIGVIKGKFTLSMSERLAMKQSSLVDISPLMESERMVKDAREIDAIRSSAGICNKGLRFLRDFIRDGARENEIAAELEMLMKKSGSEYPAFDTIVTSGKRSAFIHPNPPASSKVAGMGPGLVDFGAVYKNYSTDVTMPFMIGKSEKKYEDMIGTVSAVWKSLEDELKPGVKTKTLHDIYGKILKDRGFSVKHSLGHSLGLEVHEYPSVSGTDVELREGMVLAIEPGVYQLGVGGCRLENTILIKKGGYESLTKSKLIRM